MPRRRKDFTREQLLALIQRNLTHAEMAEALGCSTKHVARLRARHELPTHGIGRPAGHPCRPEVRARISATKLAASRASP